MQFIKLNTESTVMIGPFFDSTSGTGLVTNITLNTSLIRLSKAGSSTFAVKENTSAGTHIENGMYMIVLGTGDTNTAGMLTVTINTAGVIPFWEYFVVQGDIGYNDLILGTDRAVTVSSGNITGGTVNAISIGTVTVTIGSVNVTGGTVDYAAVVGTANLLLNGDITVNTVQTVLNAVTVSSGNITGGTVNLSTNVSNILNAVTVSSGNISGGTVNLVTNTIGTVNVVNNLVSGGTIQTIINKVSVSTADYVTTLDYEAIDSSIFNSASSNYITPGTYGAMLNDMYDENFGKWVLDPSGNTLTLYKSDGVSVLKTFNLTTTTADIAKFISRNPV